MIRKLAQVLEFLEHVLLRQLVVVVIIIAATATDVVISVVVLSFPCRLHEGIFHRLSVLRLDKFVIKLLLHITQLALHVLDDFRWQIIQHVFLQTP